MSVRIALSHQKQLGTSSPCPHLGIQRGEADLWSPFCPAVLHVLTHRRCILSLFLFAARQSALDGNEGRLGSHGRWTSYRSPSNVSTSSDLWSASSSGGAVWLSAAMPMASSSQNRRKIWSADSST
ncbi:hypothetical protein T05_6026 [Trichinella murrelli]|uniref:Uncharacterized protein n=1 Tax=Trichinella murrelli TaxID=144512 RepID=A0A0V0T6N5_9BILA|nr:hypothetical protein T05_11515 [Trichinella murrelli]KRX38629.1 hypothetical protein T05_6026 [Trichinella murrelli]